MKNLLEKLSERERKLLYVLFGLIIIFIIYKMLWLKQSEIYSQAKNDYEQAYNQIQIYQNTASSLQSLKDENLQLNSKITQVMTPFSIDITGGEHMRLIGEFFESSGLKVISANPVAVEDGKEFLSQNIAFKIKGSYGALQEFFYNVENSALAINVKKFDIYPEANANSTNPILAAINYNNLTADIVVAVHGDKMAVSEVAYKDASLKFDLFKPTDEDMKKLEVVQKAYEPEANNPVQVVTAEQQKESYLPPLEKSNNPDEVTASEVKPEKEVINYGFEKR